MKPFYDCLLLFAFSLTNLSGQTGQTESGLELQLYPTGVIPGIFIQKETKNGHLLYGRVGANIF